MLYSLSQLNANVRPIPTETTTVNINNSSHMNIKRYTLMCYMKLKINQSPKHDVQRLITLLKPKFALVCGNVGSLITMVHEPPV